MKAFGATDRGLRREANEDRFALEVWDRSWGYAFVCDGMGGEAGGGLAAELCAAELRRVLGGSLRRRMEESSRIRLLQTAISNANRRIYGRAEASGPELKGMGTTLCLALFQEDAVTVANSGDSRCYRLRDGRLICLTRDHSVTAESAEGDGRPETAADGRPLKSYLTRAIGCEPEARPDYTSVRPEPGDLYLICSDGLYNQVSDEKLTGLLLESARKGSADGLIRAANEAGGADNCTAVVIIVEA